MIILQGIAEFAGGYPNEFLLYQRLQNPQGEVPESLYFYVGAMALLSLLSIYFQWTARTLGEKNALLAMVTLGRAGVSKAKARYHRAPAGGSEGGPR